MSRADVGASIRVPHTTPQQRDRAALTVARYAIDAEDCRQRLYELGLLADPEARPGTRGKGRVA